MSGTVDAIDSLSPWEAIPYFQAPRESLVALLANTPGQLCKADPQRVALIFSCSGANTVSVSLSANPVSGQGLNISGSFPPIQLLFAEVGPYVQQAFFGLTSFGLNVTVIEVTLAKWPKLKAGNGRNGSANATRSAKRNGRRG